MCPDNSFVGTCIAVVIAVALVLLLTGCGTTFSISLSDEGLSVDTKVKLPDLKGLVLDAPPEPLTLEVG